ncbi:MAG: hypothetical protein ACYC6F_18395 [Longimicrobiales bacterium]
MNIRRSLVLVIAAWLTAGCTDSLAPGPRDETAPIQTDRLSYDAKFLSGEGQYRQYGFDLIAKFTNGTQHTAYLSRCYPDSEGPIYQVRGAGFESAYDGLWACVGHSKHIPVAAGQVRVDTLHIRGPNGWSDGVPQGRLEGVFELLYYVWFCADECGDQAPQSASTSNRFSIKGP